MSREAIARIIAGASVGTKTTLGSFYPRRYDYEKADLILTKLRELGYVHRSDILKEVGEWLEKKVEDWASFQGYKVVSLGAIESLKTGVMPDG